MVSCFWPLLTLTLSHRWTPRIGTSRTYGPARKSWRDIRKKKRIDFSPSLRMNDEPPLRRQTGWYKYASCWWDNIVVRHLPCDDNCPSLRTHLVILYNRVPDLGLFWKANYMRTEHLLQDPGMVRAWTQDFMVMNKWCSHWTISRQSVWSAVTDIFLNIFGRSSDTKNS